MIGSPETLSTDKSLHWQIHMQRDLVTFPISWIGNCDSITVYAKIRKDGYYFVIKQLMLG